MPRFIWLPAAQKGQLPGSALWKALCPTWRDRPQDITANSSPPHQHQLGDTFDLGLSIAKGSLGQMKAADTSSTSAGEES